MEGAPPHGIEGKVPIAPSRFLDTRTGQTPLQTSVRACPRPKTNLLPSSLLSLSTLALTFGTEDPHTSVGQVAKLKLGLRIKLRVRPSPTWNSLPEEHRSQILVSSRFPGFTRFSGHPNSVSDHPQVRGLPSSEPRIPGACSPAAARINTNPNPNTRICGRGRRQPGAMIASPAAAAVCSYHLGAETPGCGSAPPPPSGAEPLSRPAPAATASDAECKQLS